MKKKVQCDSSPTSSISTVRKHFWTEQSRLCGGASSPRKYGVICCMPAVVSNTVGSLIGTREEDGTSRWPFDSKNETNAARTSAPVM